MTKKKSLRVLSQETRARTLTGSRGAVPAKRALAGTSVRPLEIFDVPERHPSESGPWSAEADKLSWIDPSTGLPCILLRATDGSLGGYVGVGPDHPLHGVSADALPHDPSLVVHGGVTYAEPCEDYMPRSISICHVPPPLEPTEPMLRGEPDKEVVEPAHDLWWFGFRCNHDYDLVPNSRDGKASNEAEYRDEAYVVRETSNLAAQLHAIAEGLPMPEPVGKRPPIGLEASKARRSR